MRLILPPDVRRGLKSWLWHAGRQEIGGIIMAEQLEPGRFIVRKLSLDATAGSAAHFVRSPEHHTQALHDFFHRTGSDFSTFNYLGEWHSHPSFPTTPSMQDLASMRDLVMGERDITFAVLLIVRLRYVFKLDVAAYAFARDRAPHAIEVDRG